MEEKFLNSRKKIADFRKRLSSIGTMHFVEALNGDTDLFSKDEIELFNEIFSNFDTWLSWFLTTSPTAKISIVKIIADELALNKDKLLQLEKCVREIKRIKIACEE